MNENDKREFAEDLIQDAIDGVSPMDIADVLWENSITDENNVLATEIYDLIHKAIIEVRFD